MVLFSLQLVCLAFSTPATTSTTTTSQSTTNTPPTVENNKANLGGIFLITQLLNYFIMILKYIKKNI